jgi:hypothetical protein
LTGVVSLDFFADDCKISRLDFLGRSPARYGGINLRLCFFTTNVIVLVSKKLISPACCSLSWLTVTKKATNKHKGKEIEGKMQEPQPSTSGLNNKRGPIELSPSTSFNSMGCHLLHTQQTSSSSVNSTSLNSCESSDDNSIGPPLLFNPDVLIF